MTEFTQTIYYNIIRYTLERSTGKFSLDREYHKPIYEKKTTGCCKTQAESQIWVQIGLHVHRLIGNKQRDAQKAEIKEPNLS